MSLTQANANKKATRTIKLLDGKVVDRTPANLKKAEAMLAEKAKAEAKTNKPTTEK